jgi:hypothetical protein
MAIFRTFFGISEFQGNREKFQGNFRQKSPISGKFHAKFLRNRLYLCDVQKKNQKKTVSGEFRGGFQHFRTGFSGNFPDLYLITLNFTCVYPAAQSVFCEKHRKCKTFSGISRFWKSREEFFPNFRAVFRRFSFFQDFQISGNRGPNFFRNLPVDYTLLKWRFCALRF